MKGFLRNGDKAALQSKLQRIDIENPTHLAAGKLGKFHLPFSEKFLQFLA
jgi:hypothetical protein